MELSLPPLPGALDLNPLFSGQVFSSCGETSADTLGGISPLRPGEIPAGYDRWVEKRQREYRSGRHHVRRALLSAGLDACDIRRGDDGLPLFPEGVRGSITHTGRDTTFAAAAICLAPLRIGLDAENLKELNEGMVDVILSPAERRQFKAWPPRGAHFDSELCEGQFALWAFSMKEAYYKCVYPACGIKFGFHDISITPRFAEKQFTIKVENSQYSELPQHLTGRYHIDNKRIISAVTWPDAPHSIRF